MTLSQLKRCCLSALPALLFVLVAPGCDRAVNKEAAKAKQDPEVYFSKPKHEVITDFEDFTGRAEAEKTVEITSRVTGYLQKILFKDGDEVTADTPLFEIDPRPYKAIVDRTEATLAQTEARVKRAEADFNRIRNLFNRGAASREDPAEGVLAVDVGHVLDAQHRPLRGDKKDSTGPAGAGARTRASPSGRALPRSSPSTTPG